MESKVLTRPALNYLTAFDHYRESRPVCPLFRGISSQMAAYWRLISFDSFLILTCSIFLTFPSHLGVDYVISEVSSMTYPMMSHCHYCWSHHWNHSNQMKIPRMSLTSPFWVVWRWTQKWRHFDCVSKCHSCSLFDPTPPNRIKVYYLLNKYNSLF